jgi:hypothetical protein
MTGKNIESSPSSEDWGALYEEAIKFKELTPWNWMWDSDLFGIQDPVTGEIGYCCVLGKGGEVFGLAVYLGSEGLEGYLRVSEGEVDVEDDDILHLKKCLLLSYDDRRYLEKSDLKVIKDLGLEFKGRNAWPLFRSYQPGYYPWYLNSEQAQYFTLCLQQARDTALHFKENPNLFDSSDADNYFVRICEGSAGNMKWKDAWLKPAPLKEMVVIVKTVDGQRLENIKQRSSREKQVWGVDFFYAPVYIAEKGKRPYFPVALLVVDNYSRFIFNAHITTHDKYRIEFYEQFLKAIEGSKVIPEEIWVRKKELFVYLKQLAQALGIKMRLVKKLQAVDEARRYMFEHFDRRR